MMTRFDPAWLLVWLIRELNALMASTFMILLGNSGVTSKKSGWLLLSHS